MNELSPSNSQTIATPKPRVMTAAERRVMAVLVNPEHRKTNFTQKIKASGVGRTRYYQIVGDPWFRAQVNEFFFVQLAGEISEILDASVSVAKWEDRDGHNDRKMILEMVGLVGQDKGDVNVQVNTSPLPIVNIFPSPPREDCDE